MPKEIVIPVSEMAETEKNSIINFLSPCFDENFGIDLSENGFKISLISLDFEKFTLLCKQLIKQDTLSDLSKRVILQLQQEIANIKSYGLKGGKRIYVDYNKERKVQDRKNKVEKRQQFYYTRGNDFTTNINAVPKEFENKILCGDSYQILKKLPDNCIDVVLTSPPYNFGLDYDNSADDYHWENYFEQLFNIFKECVRVLKFGGRAIINVQPLFSDYIPTHHIISNFFLNQKMIWKGEILWEKNNYNCKYTAWGSWKSPSNPYLKYTWEFIEIFCKGTLKKEGKTEYADISADDFKKWVVGKWSIAPERRMKEFGHPAMFPEELVHRALQLFSFENDIVLDPFNGAGTTTFVAKKLNRRFLGIDISEDYTTVANNRIKSILL